MSLEVLLGGSDELDGDKLVATEEHDQREAFYSVVATQWAGRRENSPTLLEAADDGTDQTTLHGSVSFHVESGEGVWSS